MKDDEEQREEKEIVAIIFLSSAAILWVTTLRQTPQFRREEKNFLIFSLQTFATSFAPFFPSSN